MFEYRDELRQSPREPEARIDDTGVDHTATGEESGARQGAKIGSGQRQLKRFDTRAFKDLVHDPGLLRPGEPAV